MNKTKIDWAEYSFNPVTGCLHDCEYCYARKIANRFKPTEFELMNIQDCKPIIPISAKNLSCYECEDPVKLTNFKGEVLRITPYPMGFKPTIHKYRLNEPSRKNKGVTIFVCSMADLFGEWVPDEWIKEVFEACEKAPQHRYLFLTKNPRRYIESIPQWESYHGGLNNIWLGTTVTSSDDRQRAWDLLTNTSKNTNKFLSIEPLLGEFDLDKYELLLKDYRNIPTLGNYLDWIIVGAETGNRKGKIVPKKEWILDIKEQCRAAGVPLFMKESLRELMGQDFMQEFPW